MQHILRPAVKQIGLFCQIEPQKTMAFERAAMSALGVIAQRLPERAKPP
jgi:hypothetical protein